MSDQIDTCLMCLHGSKDYDEAPCYNCGDQDGFTDNFKLDINNELIKIEINDLLKKQREACAEAWRDECFKSMSMEDGMHIYEAILTAEVES